MHGEYKVPEGKLVVVDLQVADGRLADVRISGDFFLEPDSALEAMNAVLEGMLADSGEDAFAEAVERALVNARPYGLTARGVAVAVQRALGQEGSR